MWTKKFNKINKQRLRLPRFQVTWNVASVTLFAKTVTLYLLFYAWVLGFSVLLFFLANLSALHRDIPYLTGENSPLNLQPGVSIRPQSDSLTSLIRYRPGDRSTYAPYVHDIFSFVQSYERHTEYSRLSDCSKVHSYMDHPKYSCKFTLDIEHKNCNMGLQYGFDETNPCIAVKLNRVLGWMPSFKDDNETISGQGYPTVKIKCEGVTQSDRDQYKAVCYYDEEASLRNEDELEDIQQGGCSLEYGQIRNYYFPYKKQRSYQIPFVWARFVNVKRHVVIMIQCWAIADNIVVDFDKGIGSTRFELLLD